MLVESDESDLLPGSKSIVDWAGRLSSSERTGLLVDWIGKASNRSVWVSRLADQGLDERDFVSKIGAQVQIAAVAADREGLARNIVALRPADAGAQHAVAEIVLGRLDADTKADADIAKILIPALGTGHRLTRRLNVALATAVGDGRLKLTDRDRDALRAAGLNSFRRRILGIPLP